MSQSLGSMLNSSAKHENNLIPVLSVFSKSWFFLRRIYAISQIRIVRSGLHLVTYPDVGNFCNKSTEITFHKICVQVFLRFSDYSKPSQSVSLIYELAWLAGICKSEENGLKTFGKVAPVTKVAHWFWWYNDNQKPSASAHKHLCDVNCDIPYWSGEFLLHVAIKFANATFCNVSPLHNKWNFSISFPFILHLCTI